jgi:hypothetical protein
MADKADIAAIRLLQKAIFRLDYYAHMTRTNCSVEYGKLFRAIRYLADRDTYARTRPLPNPSGEDALDVLRDEIKRTRRLLEERGEL